MLLASHLSALCTLSAAIKTVMGLAPKVQTKLITMKFRRGTGASYGRATAPRLLSCTEFL